jgi:hypothetical protein
MAISKVFLKKRDEIHVICSCAQFKRELGRTSWVARGNPKEESGRGPLWHPPNRGYRLWSVLPLWCY